MKHTKTNDAAVRAIAEMIDCWNNYGPAFSAYMAEKVMEHLDEKGFKVNRKQR